MCKCQEGFQTPPQRDLPTSRREHCQSRPQRCSPSHLLQGAKKPLFRLACYSKALSRVQIFRKINGVPVAIISSCAAPDLCLLCPWSSLQSCELRSTWKNERLLKAIRVGSHSMHLNPAWLGSCRRVCMFCFCVYKDKDTLLVKLWGVRRTVY